MKHCITWRDYFRSKEFLDKMKADQEKCAPKIEIRLANEVNFASNKNEKK